MYKNFQSSIIYNTLNNLHKPRCGLLWKGKIWAGKLSAIKGADS